VYIVMSYFYVHNSHFMAVSSDRLASGSESIFPFQSKWAHVVFPFLYFSLLYDPVILEPMKSYNNVRFGDICHCTCLTFINLNLCPSVEVEFGLTIL